MMMIIFCSDLFAASFGSFDFYSQPNLGWNSYHDAYDYDNDNVDDDKIVTMAMMNSRMSS